MGCMDTGEIPYLSHGTVVQFRKIDKSQIISMDVLRKMIPPDNEKLEVPAWERYTLTIEEAAEYFRIGRARLRQLVHENPDADFLLMVGNRMQIKRKLFEKYIDKASVI